MCGIAGLAGELSNKNLIHDMLKIMKHRGPDSEGFYYSDRVHLGHCRLAINDLSPNANQPFVSSDNRIAVSVNGEIYNFKKLKTELLEKGYTFKSNSDSEVVLHGYIDQNLSFIQRLNGMFAISLWDGKEGQLILVRDRLGIKPLYYAVVKNCFIFASEIKALALYDRLDLSLDLQSLAEYLTFENYFSNRTLNKNIKLVEPGEIVIFKPRNGTIGRHYYWKPDVNTSGSRSDGDIYTRYISIAEASVDRHLISDVPVGCYLSSGIDSSTVSYWASRRLNGNLKTFTGSFGLTGFYDEATPATEIAKTFGCSNHRVEITPGDFLRNIDKILWHLDEPRVGMGAFSQYMVAKTAARKVKVILTGHGGDEFFAGYPVFKVVHGKHDILKLIWKSSPRELMFAVYFLIFPLFRREVRYFLPNIFPVKSLRRLLSPDFYSMLVQESDVFKEPEALKMMYADEYQHLFVTYLKYYLPALFIVEDKISMAFSLESRVPLCDNEMLDFALSIPLLEKLKGYELKHIPRTAMKGKLPEFIYNLPKRGFPTPLRLWFRKELREHIRSFIFDNISFLEMFNRKEVERIVVKYQRSKVSTPFDEIEAHKIWIILNLIHYFTNQRKRYSR